MKTIAIIIVILILILVSLSIYYQIKDHFSQYDPMILRLKNILKNIAPEIMDKINIYKGDKSYTINKRNVYLCLLDEKGKYYNINTLVYVMLHECAHVKSKSVGHTREFDRIFKNLLKKAERMKYFDPKNKIPENYCQY